jgi:hypothetical protein
MEEPRAELVWIRHGEGWMGREINQKHGLLLAPNVMQNAWQLKLLHGEEWWRSWMNQFPWLNAEKHRIGVLNL